MMGCGLFTVASSSSRVFSALEGGAIYEYLLACVKRNKVDSELLLNLLSISQTTFRHSCVRFYAFFFCTTFVETAVYHFPAFVDPVFFSLKIHLITRNSFLCMLFWIGFHLIVAQPKPKYIFFNCCGQS